MIFRNHRNLIRSTSWLSKLVDAKFTPVPKAHRSLFSYTLCRRYKNFQNNDGNNVTTYNGNIGRSKNYTFIQNDTIGRRYMGTQVPRPYIDPKLSYVYGRSNDHLIYSTVARELKRKILESPDEIGYISQQENKQATFRQLDHEINKLCKSLANKFNIKKGDAISVYAYNCFSWGTIELACARMGAILVPINPSYKTNELAFVLKNANVKCLFLPGPKSVQSELNNHMNALQSDQVASMLRSGELALRNVILMDSENDYQIIDRSNKKSGTSTGFPIEWRLDNCRIHEWKDLDNDGIVYRSVEEAEEAGVKDLDSLCILDLDAISPDDLFAIYYTSGTTGTPKGACISNFTVINNVRFAQARIRNGVTGSKLTIANTLPMFHIFAGVLTFLSPIMSNSCVIYSSYKYDIEIFVKNIIDYKCNAITVTPTMLIDFVSYVEYEKLGNEIKLKIIQSGGAALPPEMVKRTFKVLPNLEELRTGYGSSENGAIATFQTIHEPSETKAVTVGPPIDFTEIRIVEPNTDNVVPLGEKGEVQTRGFNTMTSYLNLPEKTKEVLPENRWYQTGDIGIMHPHGSIQICGRLKHMIIKGGENIYPEEIQQLIHKLDFVEDVHVIGIPDDRFGEQVCAWVKLRSGYVEAGASNGQKHLKEVDKDDIIKYCKDNITYFKVPKYLMIVDEFPLTPTRKVQNHIMVDMTCEMLGIKRVKN